jgi:hypothetical protein
MWWIYVVIVAVLALGIYGFLSLVRLQTRWLTSKTNRRAEDMYDNFAGSPGRRHRRS